MAYDFQTLQTEVYERGYQYLNDGGTGAARVARYINDAMHTVDAWEDWPYLAATTTGVAPMTITDLQTVMTVATIANNCTLYPRDRRDLREEFVDLTLPGIPQYFYLVNNVINVYPVSTSTTLTVDYQKVEPDLSSNTDTPLMPDRYRYCIVEYVVTRCARDESDVQGQQVAQAAGDLIVSQMTADLLKQQHQRSQDIVWMSGTDT